MLLHQKLFTFLIFSVYILHSTLFKQHCHMVLTLIKFIFNSKSYLKLSHEELAGNSASGHGVVTGTNLTLLP